LDQEFQDLAAYDIERLFGGPFAERLADLPLGRWSGPVDSPYGWHLVLVRERIESRLPDLDDVRDAVTRDWRAARREEANRAFYEGLRAGYEVTVERPSWMGERPTAMAGRQ
jgi:parvulin-like peptidyl-prolyl isomerase